MQGDRIATHAFASPYTRGIKVISRRTNIPPRQLHKGVLSAGDLLSKSGPLMVENVFLIVDKLDEIHHDPSNGALDAFRLLYCLSISRRLIRTVVLLKGAK
jgi:hypothetical protein